jgi:hypothetical protein
MEHFVAGRYTDALELFDEELSKSVSTASGPMGGTGYLKCNIAACYYGILCIIEFLL